MFRFPSIIGLVLVLLPALGAPLAASQAATPTPSPAVTTAPSAVSATPSAVSTLEPTATPAPSAPAKPTAHKHKARVKATPTPEEMPSTQGGPAYTPATSADAIDIKRIRDKKILREVHKVEDGENFWTIASDNKIDLFTLIGANPDLPMSARLNRQVNILTERGVLHTVQKGETIQTIAALYKTDPKGLEKLNDIHWWWWKRLKEGDVLFIPGVRPIRMTAEWRSYFSKRGVFGDPLGRWGIITSPFGKRSDPLTGDVRHHSGVDLRAKWGDRVYAASSGRVIFTGISGGYGNLIQIAHKNGYITLYGHLSKILVKVGDKIKRGQLIGRVGETGRVTGPHLHFEIRKNGKAVDPLPYI